MRTNASVRCKADEKKKKSTMQRELGGFRAVRDASPDSVIYAIESNLSSSLFSSASASVDRCSFASDRDSLVSEITLQLSGCDDVEQQRSDPNKASVHISRFSRNKAIAQVEGNINKANFEEVHHDSARSSFSLALKECQGRRSRSDALSKKLDRHSRPVSLDLNNVAGLSPRLGVKKSSGMSHKICAFPSPGTPTYMHSMQKGWSSERVPLYNNAGRRPVNMGLLPYNGGRTLPSKWEDAERWICSPVQGDAAFRGSVLQLQRRPKSKSGPLGPTGAAYYSLYSPAASMFDGVNGGNFVANSPFSAGVMAREGLAIRSNGNGGAFPICVDPCMGRSASVHGCSKIPNHSSLPSEGEKIDGLRDAATNVSPDVSIRDMATQMSSEGSAHSSPKTSLSLSTSTPSALPIVELQTYQDPKSEVRDVQVDERVTVTRWPKKNKIRIPMKGFGVSGEWKPKGDGSAPASASDASTANSISKVKREEAKITAWENLQKAKAEAAIRKLQMKLEKKRSSSMDKIMNKLRLAQNRAQEMRSSVLASQAHQVTQTSQKAASFRRTHQMTSLSGCFTCHAF